MQISEIKSRIKDRPILFLLALALSVRLYNVNSPIIGTHSWRQSDTAAMARNFHTNGYNFMYPQIDWGGLPGYCETEFPIYSFIVALLYKIFGAHDFLGRLFSIICFLIAIYFLYKLILIYFNKNTAFWACLVYSVLPLNIYYSRTFQPESMLLMCSVISIYYFSNWLNSARYQDLIISGTFTSIACLLKVLPIIYLGIPLVYLASTKLRIKILSNISLWIYCLSVLLVTFAWYYHAHDIFLRYGNTFGFSANSTDRYDYHVLLSLNFWTDLIFRTVVRHFAIFLFPVFIAGLFIKRKTAQEYVFDVWLLAIIATQILVPVTSSVHEYYQLSFMLPSVVFIGKAFDLLFKKYKKFLVTCFCLSLVTGSLIYSIDYMPLEKTETSAILRLSEQVKSIVPQNSLIISSTGGDPTLLYLSDRKGWLINHRDITDEYILSKRKLGAKYLVGSFNFVESYSKVDDNQKQKVNHVLEQYPNLVKDGQNFIAKLE